MDKTCYSWARKKIVYLNEQIIRQIQNSFTMRTFKRIVTCKNFREPVPTNIVVLKT